MKRLSRTPGKFREMPEKWQRWTVTGLFILVQVFIWVIALEAFWYGNQTITDTPIYYDYASRIIRGAVPFRDFSSEYPPAGVMLFLLPRLISGAAYGFFTFWFEAEMLVFSSGIVILLSTLAWRQWGSVRQVAGVLALYSFFILALGAIVKMRFDLAAAFLILASLTSYITDRRLLAWVLIGVGVMTKVIPVFIAPIFLIAHFRRGQFREMLTGPLAALAAALAIAAPFLIIAPGGLAGSFLYHAERPLQIESTWASPLLLLSRFGGLQVEIMSSYGSHNIYSAGAETLAVISAPVTLLLLATGYLIFFKKTADPGRMSSREWQMQLTLFTTLAIATFILGGKVFSPQFLIWLLPLIPLVSGRYRRLTLVLFTAMLLMTQWEFPSRYWNLYLMETDMIIVVAVRNLLLGGVVLSLMCGGSKATIPERVTGLAPAPARFR